MLAPLLSLCVVVVAATMLLRRHHLTSAGRHMAACVASLLYVPLLASVWPLIKLEFGPSWLFITLCLAFLSDTVAYIFGRLWGRHKLYPAVSPGKTVEGAIGGVVGGVRVVGAMADLVPAEIRYPDRSGEIFLVEHAAEHRWAYFSRMDRHEALVFKQYDSRANGVARFTPHAAFDLPDVGPLDCATHIHLATHHWNAPQMHTSTPGIGVLCRRAHKPQQLGGVSLVRNSHGMPAVYAFGGYQPLQAGNVRVGAISPPIRRKAQKLGSPALVAYFKVIAI